MTATTHWHAFAYTGRGIVSDAEIRRGTAPADFPPLVVQDWLTRRDRKGQIPDTHLFTEAQIEDAVSWLETELTAYPPLDVDSFTIPARIGHARDRLCQRVNRDIAWGYWSRGGRYVSRALILCTGKGTPCQ